VPYRICSFARWNIELVTVKSYNTEYKEQICSPFQRHLFRVGSRISSPLQTYFPIRLLFAPFQAPRGSKIFRKTMLSCTGRYTAECMADDKIIDHMAFTCACSPASWVCDFLPSSPVHEKRSSSLQTSPIHAFSLV
jgi:hypothetical protein